MSLSNLELHLEPETTLYKEEADVIIAIVFGIMKEIGVCAKHGTFLLYGVKNDSQEPQKIISFDLRRGPSAKFMRNEKRLNSRKMAEEVLERDARSEKSTFALQDTKAKGYITYYADSPLFLSLQATHGRFTCAFYAGDGDYWDMTFVYCAVAQALAVMGKEDEVLQESCDDLFFSEVDEYTTIFIARNYVNSVFEEDVFPEIKAWRTWHDAAVAEDKLGMYFE